MNKPFSMIRKARGQLAEEKQPIQEAEKPYKLVILSHDDPLDPNETGPLIRKKAKELGIEVFLGEFQGAYLSQKGKKKFVNSFEVDDKGQAQLPDMKSDVAYAPPVELDPANTLIMVRGLGSTVKTGANSWYVMAQSLEHDGFTVINSTKCHNICKDKWLNQIMFKRHDFNTPKTVRISHQEGAKFAMEELAGVGVKYPVILKTAVGSRGIGVMWVESEKALYGFVQLLYREDPYIDILLQEWIKTPYDVRVIVAAGHIMGAIKRPIVEGDFRSNVSQGSEPEPFELTKLEASEAIRAAEMTQGKLCGVDFIPAKNREKDKPYFIEVNSTPGLMGIEATLSKAAAKPLQKDLKSEGKSITTEVLKLFMDRDNWIDKSKNS